LQFSAFSHSGADLLRHLNLPTGQIPLLFVDEVDASISKFRG